ncbi:helix-turn-helix transcriptional regulator [Nannocystis pusilla]|uniref:helix-turn-helix transcriptional regulator n=1 Tax=Nannocystis pusilla TaxID=889268 RepID=UPI003B7BCDBC
MRWAQFCRSSFTADSTICVSCSSCFAMVCRIRRSLRRYNRPQWGVIGPCGAAGGRVTFRRVSDLLLSPKEVAALLRIHRDTLKKWRVRGEGPQWIRKGGRYAYLESKSTAGSRIRVRRRCRQSRQRPRRLERKPRHDSRNRSANLSVTPPARPPSGSRCGATVSRSSATSCRCV